MNKVNLLICGVPRNITEFYLALKYIDSLKAQGLVNRVVMSTWAGSVSAQTCEYLRGQGIEVLLQRDARMAGPGNMLRQYRQFAGGLALFSRDDIVIKMRTDWNIGLRDVLDSTLACYNTAGEKPAPEPFAHPDFQVLGEKVMVNRASLIYPARVQEVNFAAKKSTLEALTHCSAYHFGISDDKLLCEYGPEFTWFGYPFVSRFPLIQALLNKMDLRLIGQHLEQEFNNKRADKLSDAIVALLAFNAMLVVNNFILPDHTLAGEQTNEEAGGDIFSLNVTINGCWENIVPLGMDYRVSSRHFVTRLAASDDVLSRRCHQKMLALAENGLSTDEQVALAGTIYQELQQLGMIESKMQSEQGYQYLPAAQGASASGEFFELDDFNPAKPGPELQALLDNEDSSYLNIFGRVVEHLKPISQKQTFEEFMAVFRRFNELRLIDKNIKGHILSWPHLSVALKEQIESTELASEELVRIKGN
ncbi:hypothetical protein SG34_031205 [Thalassomonas viridans]|uniref:Uncharacterized protein n=1 Tax=Thalassomonas viridans TaxID=137584 RepID=A0AAE9ZF44_9GAMM|nr:hypothetical protein [Thalassomonas viridans]WDE09233.1 hypothetical protein SG34_031205 [Thalassomonas viridans]